MTIKIFGLWGSFPCFRDAAVVTSVWENSNLQEPGTGRSSTVSESRGVVHTAASEVQMNTGEDPCITQSTSSKKKIIIIIDSQIAISYYFQVLAGS